MLTLSVGQLVSIRFDRPGDAVYLFDTVVTEVRASDESPYALARPVNIDRRRHRSDVRLALVLDATYELHGPGDTEPQHAKVVDLSAGGLGLITTSQHDIGEALVVNVALPGPGEALHFESSVIIRTRSLFGRTPDGAVLRQYGLEFVDVSDQIRDKILGLVIWNLTQNPAVL
jgi:c-di-GMP-binding flagellar brake protein YcgR